MFRFLQKSAQSQRAQACISPHSMMIARVAQCSASQHHPRAARAAAVAEESAAPASSAGSRVSDPASARGPLAPGRLCAALGCFS